MNKKRKQEKGITLIALVITIIVLLILAGVTIAMLTGENGILNKATTAQEKTIEAEEQEKIRLAYSEVIANKLDGTIPGEISASDIVNALEKQGVDTTKITVEPTGDGKTKVVFETGHEYTIDQNGKIGTVTSNGSSGSDTSTVNYQSITDLRDGDQVIYIDNNGTQIPCTVLYDSTNANYSTYGVQIIANDVVGSGVQLGTRGRNDETALLSTKNAFNDAIGILNRAAESYLNTDLATSARCVGSVPNNKNYKNTAKHSNGNKSYWIDNFGEEYESIIDCVDDYDCGEETIVEIDDSMNGKTKQSTTQYFPEDALKMYELDILNASEYYWLASRESHIKRYIYPYGLEYGKSSFYVKYVLNRQNKESIPRVELMQELWVQNQYLLDYNGPEDVSTVSTTYGLRPVFTLKSDIKVVDGENNTKVLTKAE